MTELGFSTNFVVTSEDAGSAQKVVIPSCKKVNWLRYGQLVRDAIRALRLELDETGRLRSTAVWVKPRKAKVSGHRSPRCCRALAGRGQTPL